MAGHKELEDESSEENCTKMWRTIRNQWSTGTSDLLTEATGVMENSQCIPCDVTSTIHQEQSLWEQLPKTITQVIRRQRSLWSWNNPQTSEKRKRLLILDRRQRSLWSWNNPQTSEKRKRLLILHKMERLSHYRGNMGTHFSLLNRWRYVKGILRKTSIIEADWTITKRMNKNNKNPKEIWRSYHSTQEYQIDEQELKCLPLLPLKPSSPL
jgi:hypothetical protein